MRSVWPDTGIKEKGEAVSVALDGDQGGGWGGEGWELFEQDPSQYSSYQLRGILTGFGITVLCATWRRCYSGP